jgi:hypothetical protein
VYDHCPFCVRVRLAFGIKNVKFRLGEEGRKFELGERKLGERKGDGRGRRRVEGDKKG